MNVHGLAARNLEVIMVILLSAFGFAYVFERHFFVVKLSKFCSSCFFCMRSHISFKTPKGTTKLLEKCYPTELVVNVNHVKGVLKIRDDQAMYSKRPYLAIPIIERDGVRCI